MPVMDERRTLSSGFVRKPSGQTLVRNSSGRGSSSLSQRIVDEDSESEPVDIVGDPEGDLLSDESDGEDDETHAPRRSRYDVVFIFELLWRTRKSSGFPNIWLPETIVIRNNQPTGWYFTHPHDGRIMKRNLGQEHFITQKKILEVFDGATGEVAAVFVNTIELHGKRVVGNTQYFDRQHLREFLYTEDPNRNGFLQKFVSIRQQRYGSASQTNQTLQTLNVSWKRGDLRSTRVEQRVNFLRVIQSQRNGEGPPFNYARADLRSTIALAPQSHIVIKISEACQRIVDHCKATSQGAVRITRMKCTFKIGVKGILWLNQCSSVDIEDRASRPPTANSGPRLNDQFASHRVRSHEGGFQRKRDASRDTMPQIVADRKGNAETWTRPVSDTAFSNNDEKTFADTFNAASPSCAMCGCSTGTAPCSVTCGDISRILQLWAMRTKTDADRSNAGTANDSSRTEQDGGSNTSRLWQDMRLSEQDKVTLSELRSRLYTLQVPEAAIERLELQLASLDTRITGLISHSLFNKAAELTFHRSKQLPTTAVYAAKPVVADLDPTTLKLLDRILTRDEMSRYECLDFLEDVKSSHKPRSPKGKQTDGISLLVENLRRVMPKREVDSLVELDDSSDVDSRPFFFEAGLEVCERCFNSVVDYMDSPDQPDFHLQALLMPQKVPASGRALRSSQLPLGLTKPSKIDLEWSRTFQQDGSPRRLPALPSNKSGPKRGQLFSESQSSIDRLSTGSALSGASSRKKSRFMSPRAQRIKSSPRPAPVTGEAALHREDSLKSASNDELLAEMERRELLAVRIVPHAPSQPQSSASRSEDQDAGVHAQQEDRSASGAGESEQSEQPQAPREDDTSHDVDKDTSVPEDQSPRPEQEVTSAAAEEAESEEEDETAVGGLAEVAVIQQPAPKYDWPGRKKEQTPAPEQVEGSEEPGGGEDAREEAKAVEESPKQPERAEEQVPATKPSAAKYDWPGRKTEELEEQAAREETPVEPVKVDEATTVVAGSPSEAPAEQDSGPHIPARRRPEHGDVSDENASQPGDQQPIKSDEQPSETEEKVGVGDDKPGVPPTQPGLHDGAGPDSQVSQPPEPQAVEKQQPAGAKYDWPGRKQEEPPSLTADDERKEYRPSSEKPRLTAEEASEVAHPEISDEFTFESSAAGDGSVGDEIPSGVETSASLDELGPAVGSESTTGSQPAETIPDPEEEKAALAIQSGMRGMMERKALQERRAQEAAEEERAKREAAQNEEWARVASTRSVRREASMPSVGEDMDEEGAQMWSMKLGHEGMNPELHDSIVGMDEEKAAVVIQSGVRGMMERKTLSKARRRADSPRPDELGNVAAGEQAGMDEEKAAIAIQSGMRGMMERKALRESEWGRAKSSGVRKEASMPSVGEDMDEEGAQMWSMKLGNEGMKLELQGDLSGMDEEKAAVAIQSGMQGMMEREALRKKARQRADSPRPDEMGHVGAPPEQTAAEQPAANQDETSEGQAATAGPPVAEEKAVLTIQSGLRGMRDRKSARSLRADEEGMRKEQEEMLDAMMLEEQRMMEAQMFQGQRLGSEVFGENSESPYQSMSTEQLSVNQLRQTVPIQTELSFSSYSSLWSQYSAGSVAESVTSSVYPQDSAATATSGPTETVSTQPSSDALDGGSSSTVFPIPEDSVPDPTTAPVQSKGSFRSGGELRSQRYREAQGPPSSSVLQPSAPPRPKDQP